MRRTWVSVAILVIALLGVQHFGLERTREKKEEDRYTRYAELKTTRMLPQYVAALFMGSFRAVAVDVLWVELKRLQDHEHRYFEIVEIMDLIHVLQPRNPEVWSNQAWNAAYNIANNVRDPEEQWKWIRTGLEKLMEGATQLNDDPYLKYQIGYTLVNKATWSDGVFQEPYTSRFVADLDLQRLLRCGRPSDRAMTPFEAAIPWFEAAIEDLNRMKTEQRWRYYRATSGKATEDRDYHTTQVGLNIHPSSADGFIYWAKLYNAFYYWRQKRADKAAEWFRAASAHARLYRKRYRSSSPIFDDYAVMCDRLARASEMPAEAREERRLLLETLTPVLVEAGNKDCGYLRVDLSALKQEMGGDGFEFNDCVDCSRKVEFEEVIEATIAPGADVDFFEGSIRPAGEDPGTFPPHRVAFQIKKDGDLDLKATLWAFQGVSPLLRPVATRELRENRWEEIEGITEVAGHFEVSVEALDPSAKARNPVYLLRWSLAEPAR
ncbi:MAG: hypothetical protein HYY16_07970 [Planctomycetes bacterium]|nr:hypothetical protein [Planctomycetota bacterium]